MGPDVLESQLLEEHPRDQQLLDGALHGLSGAHERPSDDGPGELALDAVSKLVVARVEAHPGEVARQRAHVLRDGHLVVVEHDDHARAEMADVVQCLERHAAGQRPVPDDHKHGLVSVPGVTGKRDTQGNRERVRGMSCVKRVELRLAALGKPAHAPVLPQRREALTTSGEQFVHVGLVSDVEDDPIVRAVESAMNAERELDDPEVGCEVTAGLRDGRDELVANLGRKLGQLSVVK